MKKCTLCIKQNVCVIRWGYHVMTKEKMKNFLDVTSACLELDSSLPDFCHEYQPAQDTREASFKDHRREYANKVIAQVKVYLEANPNAGFGNAYRAVKPSYSQGGFNRLLKKHGMDLTKSPRIKKEKGNPT